MGRRQNKTRSAQHWQLPQDQRAQNPVQRIKCRHGRGGNRGHGHRGTRRHRSQAPSRKGNTQQNQKRWAQTRSQSLERGTQKRDISQRMEGGVLRRGRQLIGRKQK